MRVFEIIIACVLFLGVCWFIKYQLDEMYEKLRIDLKKLQARTERDCFSVIEQGRKLCDQVEDELNNLKNK